MEAQTATSTSPAPPHPGSDAAWLALARAETAEALCRAWLATLCGMIPGVRAGLLLLQDPDGSYIPAGVWPEDRDLTYLGDVARECLGRREGVVHREGGSGARLAYPLLVGDRLYGSAVLDLADGDPAAVTYATRLTHWGGGWLVDLFTRRELGQRDGRLARSGVLFDVALAALAEDDYRKAALAVVNLLGQKLDCHQVLVGREKGKHVAVTAVSHSAWFDERANRVNLAAQAMNEAFDQRARILWPEEQEGPTLITVAHRRYAEESEGAHICTLPMEDAGRVAGVLMLERGTPFRPEELELLETLAVVLAPVMALKEGAEEGLLRHAGRSLRSGLTRVTDSSHPGIKLVVVTVLATVLVLGLWQTDFRVSSRAVVEGAVQRAAVAPFEGYIRDAPARAGDVVAAGEVLARLEDQDLRLEAVRWESELQVALRREREALANNDRVNARLAAAQADQARAQLDLVRARLARVEITAPFDGVVVQGDLTQKLGSPVEQGEVLFEMAPLDAWRVILQVDERDIGFVEEDRAGELVLSSIPGRPWPFTVTKVTPVAKADEGRNYFRVEAELVGAAPELRPNMEGVGKVEAGRRSLLWIWTRRLVDWARMAWWEYSL
jgi:hypothetical protein